MARLKHRVPLWLLARHWWCHRGANIVLILLVAAAFPLYGIYSAWSTAVGTSGDRPIDEMDRPSPVLWTLPAWLAAGPSHDLERMLRDPALSGNLAGYMTALTVPVTTTIGMVDAWGIEPGWADQWWINIVAVGAEPGPGEALVERGMASRAGLEVGQELVVYYYHPATRARTEAELTITGWFEGGPPLVSGMIMDRGQLEALTGYRRFNAALLHAVPRPPRVASSRSWVVIERQPQFLVEAIEDAKPFGATRMPVIGLPGGREGPFQEHLPFAAAVGDTLFWDPTLPSRVLGDLYTLVAGVTGLVGLAFFLGVLGVTVAILVVVLDQERDLGIYKALGFTPEEMFRVYSVHMAFNLLAGTALGAPSLRFLIPAASTTLGLNLSLPSTALVVWTLACAGIVVWSGRMVAVLFSGPSIVSMLKEETEFDWWSLVRIGI